MIPVRKLLRALPIVLVVAAVGIQFHRPERSNPPVDPAKAWSAHVRITPEVSAILERSCYDCHSNNARWPWYSNIAPISWKISADVRSARRRLNFSELRVKAGEAPAKRIMDTLDALKEEVNEGEMPLPEYLLLHPGAALSTADVKTLSEWADGEMGKLAAGHDSEPEPSPKSNEARD